MSQGIPKHLRQEVENWYLAKLSLGSVKTKAAEIGVSYHVLENFLTSLKKRISSGELKVAKCQQQEMKDV